MLRYAVLIVRLEEANHVGIVPICPYSCIGKIVDEKVIGPKDTARGRGRRGGARPAALIIVACWDRLRSEGGLEAVEFAWRRRLNGRAFRLFVLPRVSRVPPQAVDEEDAGPRKLG